MRVTWTKKAAKQLNKTRKDRRTQVQLAVDTVLTLDNAITHVSVKALKKDKSIKAMRTGDMRVLFITHENFNEIIAVLKRDSNTYR
jgi:mRNA-degrading endonuclease RelE of RelBE toxin-antitoxin system